MRDFRNFLLIGLLAFLNFGINIYSISIKQVPAESVAEYCTKRTASDEQPYVVGVYMAARNDLFPFAGRNLRQMQNIGSSDRLKILVHFDSQKPGQKGITKRLLIEKNQIIQFGPDMSLDSGDPKSLIDFYKWQINNFRGKHIAILWNHGEGPLEIQHKQAINPSELFLFNPHTRMIELNRKIGFFDYLENYQKQLENEKPKSICFDNTTGNYLTTRDVKTAFEKLCKEDLKGGKFEAILCDACLMSSVEFASAIKCAAHYLVSSSEVVLGTGYDYSKILYPLSLRGTDTFNFVKHVVRSFQATYGKITHDYAQSAVDLSKFSMLEERTSHLSKLLIYALNNQKNGSVTDAISLSINKNFCTQFDEPTYKDFGHLLLNFQKNINKFLLIDYRKTQELRNQLQSVLQECLAIIKEIVIENAVGKGLKDATGLSIYFPPKQIHSSYFNCQFAQETHWLEFLKTFLNSKNINQKKVNRD